MQIGVLINNLGHSQLSYYVIKNLNDICANRGVTPVAFYENNIRPVITPKFPIMHMVEAWGQQGVSIATDINIAANLATFGGPSRKIYYVWDLPWVRGPQRVYEAYAGVLCNPKLELIARSESHAKLIENCFNRKVIAVADNFSFIKDIVDNELLRK